MTQDSDTIGEALFALATLAVRHRERNLSLTALSTLATLSRTGPRRLTDLAVSEGVTQPSMTTLVTQLEDLGLAERRKDPADGRVCLVAITADGEATLRSLRRAGARTVTALVDHLPDQDVQALRAAMPALHRLLDLGALVEPPGDRPPSRGTGPALRTGPLIVVGLDGSSTSWDAFAWAGGEARRCDGSLVAVYVTPLVEAVAAIGEAAGYAAIEQARDDVAQELGREARERAEELGVDLRFITERGDTAQTLTHIAHSLGADLIAVGRSAKMLHHLAGSLGRRLVARPDVPVIVVVP